jgi:hypothetical protein
MFYTEEDLSQVVNQAVSIFGRNGIRKVGKNIEFSTAIATRELGKIWYGDIDRNTLDTACVMLSTRLNQRVYLFTHDTEFNFEAARVFFRED